MLFQQYSRLSLRLFAFITSFIKYDDKIGIYLP